MKLFGYEFIVRKAGSAVVQEHPLFDIARVTLNPGDRAVLTTPGALSRDTADRIMKYWEESFPDCKAIVLTDGMKLSVLGPSTQIVH